MEVSECACPFCPCPTMCDAASGLIGYVVVQPVLEGWDIPIGLETIFQTDDRESAEEQAAKYEGYFVAEVRRA